ncbi:MAG: hypothetical protein AAGF54_07685 [Pseudomonadota bacterium]
MSLEPIRAENRPELNLTSASTLKHLIGVGLTCAVLWMIIAATIGA